MYDYDNCAIITIANGQVHLDCTFNTDAMEPIQISSYHHNGWYACQHCPLLRHAFWKIRDWWNAHVAGSIDLIANQSPADINALLESDQQKRFAGPFRICKTVLLLALVGRTNVQRRAPFYVTGEPAPTHIISNLRRFIISNPHLAHAHAKSPHAEAR